MNTRATLNRSINVASWTRLQLSNSPFSLSHSDLYLSVEDLKQALLQFSEQVEIALNENSLCPCLIHNTVYSRLIAKTNETNENDPDMHTKDT